MVQHGILLLPMVAKICGQLFELYQNPVSILQIYSECQRIITNVIDQWIQFIDGRALELERTTQVI